MAKGSRKERKKRRRTQRLEKREKKEVSRGLTASVFRSFSKGLDGVALKTPLPGCVDATVNRPDMIKFEMFEFARKYRNGGKALQRLETAFANGPLDYVSDIEHWAMEEFLYHGSPSMVWNPIDEYLASTKGRFSSAAEEQLRNWKQAEIGVFEIGNVKKGVVEVRNWDPRTRQAVGPWFHAISLNIDGVDVYRRCKGKLTVSYLSPWVPEQDLFCLMGYGLTLPSEQFADLVLFIAIRDEVEVVATPWPWTVNNRAAREYTRRWKTRHWGEWLRDQLSFPFEAITCSDSEYDLKIVTINGIQVWTAQEHRDSGVYLRIDDDQLSGATAVQPLAVSNGNAEALAEYRAYRDQVGVPLASNILERLNV